MWMSLLFACAMMGGPVIEAVETDPKLPSLQEGLDTNLDIIAINDEMRAWLDLHVSEVTSPLNRLQILVDLIFSDESLNLVYDNSRTKTAIETFETRNGNCLSFTCLFIGMARYIGINAYFQEVTNFPTWDRHGEVIVLNRHMNVRVRIDNKTHTMDFNPDADRKEHFTRVVTDARAIAQFYNNLGAEWFQQGNIDLAIAHFKHSISVDKRVSFTWSNLGVAYITNGMPEEAEQAYLEALKQNRKEYTAISNLVRLYEKTNQPDKADEYRSRANRFRQKNPYYHFFLAEEAYEQGDYKEAITHFKDAIGRKAKVHEFYFGLAKSYSQAGMHNKVSLQLKLAMKYAPNVFDQTRYSQKLATMME